MLSVVIVLASVGAGNPIASVDSSGWDDWDDTTTYSPEIDKGLPKMSSEDKQFLAQTWAYCFNDEIRERDKCIQKMEAFAYFGAIRSVISVSSAHPFRFIPISDFGHVHVSVSE